MKAKAAPTAPDRRGFLKFAGLGTIGGAAVLVAGTGVQPAEAASAPEGSGYQETDHVKAFYESARF